MSCGGQRGILYEDKPHIAMYGDLRSCGGGLSSRPLMGTHEIVVGYSGADKRRVDLLQSTDSVQQLAQRAVEPLVTVVIGVLVADVALLDVYWFGVAGPAEYSSKGAPEGPHTVGLEYERDVPGPLPEPDEQLFGVIVDLFGRDVPLQYEPGRHVAHREHPMIPAPRPDELFVAATHMAHCMAQPACLPQPDLYRR